MLRERVAILAATLLLLKCHSMSGGATGALPDQQRHRRHVPQHGCTSPRAQDFGSRYLQTGRFEARHKRGLVLDDEPTGEEWEEADRECWSATIAAIVASGSTLALQRTLKPDEQQSASAEGYGRQQRHNRRRRRRRHRYHRKDRDNSSAPRFRRMRAELSANLDAWRMRRRRARETTPAAAIVIRQHLTQLTAQLSELTGEGFRRAERLLSAANASGNVGIRIAGCAELLRRRGRELFLLGLPKKRNPDGSGGEGKLGKGKEGEAERRKMRELQLLTDKIVQNVVDVVARDGWEVVVEREGVVVHRQYLALGPDGTPEAPAAPAQAAGVPKAEASSAVVGGRVEGSADDPAPVGDDSGKSKPPQFACVKASAILSVPPEVVYLLFADNSRVGEYNEHCREVKDLEVLSQDSKITWAASGRMGPFKVRACSPVFGGDLEFSTDGVVPFSGLLSYLSGQGGGKEIPRGSSNAGGRGGWGGCEKTGTFSASARVPNMSRRASRYVGKENMISFILPLQSSRSNSRPLLKDIERSAFRPTPCPSQTCMYRLETFARWFIFERLAMAPWLRSRSRWSIRRPPAPAATFGARSSWREWDHR